MLIGVQIGLAVAARGFELNEETHVQIPTLGDARRGELSNKLQVSSTPLAPRRWTLAGT